MGTYEVCPSGDENTGEYVEALVVRMGLLCVRLVDVVGMNELSRLHPAKWTRSLVRPGS